MKTYTFENLTVKKADSRLEMGQKVDVVENGNNIDIKVDVNGPTIKMYDSDNNLVNGGSSSYIAVFEYRIVLEDLLGIKIFGDRVEICPNIPKEWDEFSALLNIKNTQINIKIKII